jgi:hypothetical protein
MSKVTRNLQLFLRSERVLAETQFKLVSRKLVLLALAAIALLLALAMFNVAGYYALMPSVGSAEAALIVALIDALIAALLGAVALLLRPGPEEEMLREVREMAIGELGADLDEVQQKLVRMGDSVERVTTNVTNLVQNPLDTLLPHLVVPAVTAITKVARSDKTQPSGKAKGKA